MRSLKLYDLIQLLLHGKSFVRISSRSEHQYLALPKKIWHTKSYEFWALLMVILHKTRPRSILELGSGRSTIFLSEYASKSGAKLISVDQNREWVAANQLIAKFGGMPDNFIHEVSLQEDGFYSVGQLRSLVDSVDFLFIDGPVRRGSTADQLQWLAEVSKSASIIVLDDVHRAHIYDQIEALSANSECKNRLFIEYEPEPKNCLCILYSDEVSPILNEAAAYMAPFGQVDYSRADCTEA